MSRRAAVAIHWFLIALAVLFPDGALAHSSKQYAKGQSKQYAKGLSNGNRWNAPPKNNTSSWKVDSTGLKARRVATDEENLKPLIRGQRSLLLDDEFETPLPTYPSPVNANPNPMLPGGYADVGNNFAPVGNGYALNGKVQANTGSVPGLASTYPGVGNEYPGAGNSYLGPGTSYAGTGNNYPGTGNSYLDTGNSYPGTGNSYPGTGTGYASTGYVYPGTGNLYPSTGTGYASTGYVYPGTGNFYPGTGTGYPEFPKITPQLGFSNSQSPGNKWNPEFQYQNPIPVVTPYPPYFGNASLPGNTPFSPLSQYSPSNTVSDIAPYSLSVNIPNLDFPGNPNGGLMQPNSQNTPVFPGYISSYNGYEQSPGQIAPFNQPNPQGLGLPEANLLAAGNLLPCQVLCCLLSLCHLFSMSPCTSCDRAPRQGQVPPLVFSSSRDASAPKVISTGRETKKEEILASPSADESPKPADGSRIFPAPTDQTFAKPSADLSHDSPTTRQTPPLTPSGSGGSIAAEQDKPDGQTVVSAFSGAGPPQQAKQPSAPLQEPPPTPPIVKGVRALEISPPPAQPTTEKTEPRAVAATRSLT